MVEAHNVLSTLLINNLINGENECMTKLNLYLMRVPIEYCKNYVEPTNISNKDNIIDEPVIFNHCPDMKSCISITMPGWVS